MDFVEKVCTHIADSQYSGLQLVSDLDEHELRRNKQNDRNKIVFDDKETLFKNSYILSCKMKILN